ncbi:MAG TPA: NAD-dependent epimerase/dehydratase family protein [Mycobacteriales bacterium]|nr:NAD-dependent epimerase/dehydratase family protein [Mycobacteriales bacterium]
MRTLVTGAAGFIGSHLVDRLLHDGHEVVAVDDLSRGRLENLADAATSDRYRFEQADITTMAVRRLIADAAPDVLFHLAAQVDVRVSVADPLLDARLNLLGTLNLLEASQQAGVGKFIFTSSGGSIYGSPESLPAAETTAVDPHSPYAASKAAGELYLAAYGHMHNLPSTSLALGNVYGPRQDPHGEAGVVAIFGTALLEGRPTRIFGDGTSTRDYVYVADVVDAFVRAMSAGIGKRFNIGTGIATPVRRLHTLVAEAVGAADAPELAPPRMGELQAIALDPTAAAEQLGWRPATDLATGVAATVEWLREVL